jgi:hypothetical protein
MTPNPTQHYRKFSNFSTDSYIDPTHSECDLNFELKYTHYAKARVIQGVFSGALPLSQEIPYGLTVAGSIVCGLAHTGYTRCFIIPVISGLRD